ncbi:MAG: hypothetical protein U1A27_09490 [Phycisphaerae bacterium]
MRRALQTGIVCGLMLVGAACRPGDPMARFIAETDAKPPAERPPKWEQVKRLIGRPAPQVGELAPDFTLATPDGRQQVTMSRCHESRPLLLLFGSFT